MITFDEHKLIQEALSLLRDKREKEASQSEALASLLTMLGEKAGDDFDMTGWLKKKRELDIEQVDEPRRDMERITLLQAKLLHMRDEVFVED